MLRHWCDIFMPVLSATDSVIYCCHVSTALWYPPCPPCSRPGACPLPWGGRRACPGWRRWTVAGRRSLHLCWWTASGPSHLWMNPPAPPERGRGRKGKDQRWNGQRIMSYNIFIAQPAVGGRCKEAFVLISILVQIKFPVCTRKLMNMSECTAMHTRIFKAIFWATRTFPSVVLWPRRHCIDYLFRVL